MIPTVLKPRKSSEKSRSAALSRFKRVVEYMGRDDEDARQKGLLSLTEMDCGVFNMELDCGTTEDREVIWQIMSSDAACAWRYQGDPLYHFDISWMEGEHPTREQFEKTVRHFIDGLGFGQCQTFWAIHRDTDNDHVHAVVNKVVLDEEGNATVIEKPRFDFRELARLAREVEIRQGWQHAPGYHVAVEQDGNKRIMTMKEAAARGLWDENWEQQKKVSLAASRVEAHNLGGDSFQSWVMQEPARALRAALGQSGATWEQVHETLAKFGVSIEPKGSGMVVKTVLSDGRILAAKASQLGKWASKASLEKQLGPWQAARRELQRATQQSEQEPQKTYEQAVREQRVAVQEREEDRQNTAIEPQKETHKASDSSREERKTERKMAREALAGRFEREQRGEKETRTQQRQAQRTALRQQHQQEKTALKAQLAGQRQQLFRDAKAQHRMVTPIELALHAREKAMQLESLQARQAQERKALTRSFAPVASVWKEWLEQQATQGDEAAQAALRGIRYQEQRNRKKQDNAIGGEERQRTEKKEQQEQQRLLHRRAPQG